MLIANAMYDTVFKYMMEDAKSAKLILSTILGKEVLALELRPQERSKLTIASTIQIFRIDFAAKVRLESGEEHNVLIELQKARNVTDLMRFRRYLGEQYNQAEPMAGIKEDKWRPLPIITIYILGFKLKGLDDIPVVHIERVYKDRANGAKIKQRNWFIDNLTHDSYVIQAPYLKAKRRNKLEKLLSIFDQSQIADKSYELDLQEQLPQEFAAVQERLSRAVLDKQLRDDLYLEEDFSNLINDQHRDLWQKIDKRDQVIEQKEQVIEEKDQALEKKDQALEEQNQLIKEQQRLIDELTKKNQE